MDRSQRERERDSIERRLYAELQDAYDHRGDDMAAHRRYEAKFRYYAAFISDGTVRTSRASILQRLLKDERALCRAREQVIA